MIALPGCAQSSLDDSATVEESSSAKLDVRSALIQPGTHLIVYGTTDDDYAIFQDGGTLYAAQLHPGAERRFVADVGANQPTVLISGRVALIWTSQFYFGNGGVSPLVVWTAAAGPKLATTSSVVSFVGTKGAAVSPDGREVLFIANADAGGTIGDIVSAAPDLSARQTLVAGANIDFKGSCAPLVGFDGKDGVDRGDRGDVDTDGARGRDRRAHPVAAYCPGAATSATLSRWDDGVRTDLATDATAPPIWSSDARGEHFFTIVGAGRTPVSITTRGGRTVLENTPTVTGFINFNGSILTVAQTANGRELHRFVGALAHLDVLANLGTSTVFSGHHAEGFRHYTDFPVSGDGRFVLYGTAQDANTFGNNLFLIDVTRAAPVPIELQPDLVAGFSFQLFTADSRHALYYDVDAATGGATLIAASLTGVNRPVSSGAPNENEHFRLTDSLVVYSDNLNGTGIDLFDHNDIMLADVGAVAITPITVASGAYNLFFPSHDRRSVVYTSDDDPTRTGLFVARVHGSGSFERQ